MRFSALFCALLALPLLPQASHAANFELTIVHANDTHSAAAGIDGRYAACREDDACTGGYARIVEAVEALRKEIRPCSRSTRGTSGRERTSFERADPSGRLPR